MSNQNGTTGSGGWDSLPMYFAYIVQGIVIGVSNMLIVFAILRYEALRKAKEYVIIMGLSLADSSNMIGFVCAGVYRIWLVFTGGHDGLATAWSCMMMPHNLLWSYFSLSNLMLVVVSIDRFLLVVFPFTYLTLTWRYAYIFVGSVYGYALSLGVLGIALTYSTRNDPPSVDVRCIAPQALGPEYTGYAYALYYSSANSALFGVTSIIIYIILYAIHKYKTNAIIAARGQIDEEKLNRQRRFTNTLGLGCISTCFLYVVPHSLGMMLSWMGYTSVFLVFWVIANMNPFVNVFLYPMRHAEMKQAIKGLLTCKEMPENLNMWSANTKASQNKQQQQTGPKNEAWVRIFH